MQLKSCAQVDLVKLFLHDQYDCGDFSEEFVAGEVQKLVRAVTNQSWDVIPPCDSGLSRFTLRFDEVTYVERCHSAEDLKRHMPDKVFQCLSADWS